MIYWLARATREQREAAGLGQIDIAAAAKVDQSTIYRFEQGKTWPRDPDRIIAGYAEELGVETFALWTHAAKRSRTSVRRKR